ncbi:MAG: cytochrome c biogenesis heme-transporting ATPase CcmA [Legionellales bacterium]
MYSAISLTIERLVCSQQQRMLFKPLNFSVSNEQIILLHGANGVGKTTCLRTLAGLIAPERGKISWQQRLLKPYDREYLLQMAYIGHQSGIKSVLTPEENIRQSLLLAGHEIVEREIHSALQRVNLSGHAKKPCGQLSSGQQRRVNLARLMLLQVPLWILDEPLTALDREGIRLVYEVFAEHQALGGSIILTSHQHIAMATSTVELEAWQC